jgi:hypothetical protein
MAVVTEEYLLVPRRARGPVVVRFDDAYVWSFVPRRDGARALSGWRVTWPELLGKRLSGTTRVKLELDGRPLFDRPVTFRGESAPLELRDNNGHRLAIDKMGHLTRVFSETDDTSVAQVIDGTRRALRDLREEGFDAHLSYGCLLGAVRDGRMIGHDSDADLAYLSAFTSPADVIRESYAMERAMRARGWRLVRMSGADLKLFHRLEDGRDVQIDIFGGFHVGETYYQLGECSGELPREALTPASTVRLEGVELPAPADPEAVLTYLYGPGWRVPDPAYQSEDPIEGRRRLDGWLRGFRDQAIAWNELIRDRRDDIPRPSSSFARWVDARVGADAGIADLGCGTGRDAGWFVRRGRPVFAFDFAGNAVRQTRRRVARNGGDETAVRTLALNDRRSVLVAGAELARAPEPVSLYARGLVGCLDAEALDHLWLLASMALRRGGALYLEFAATGTKAPAEPAGLLRRVEVDEVVRGIEARGGTVEHVEIGPGQDNFDEPDPRVARVVARWTPPEED